MTIQSLTVLSLFQTTAADLATYYLGVVPRAGVVTKVYAAQGTVATEADETMSITVTKSDADTNVLSAALVLDSSNVADIAEAGLIATTGAASVAAGDVLKCALDYTVGTGPVPQLNTILTVEITH